jgi:hypothetical protein
MGTQSTASNIMMDLWDKKLDQPNLYLSILINSGWQLEVQMDSYQYILVKGKDEINFVVVVVDAFGSVYFLNFCVFSLSKRNINIFIIYI